MNKSKVLFYSAVTVTTASAIAVGPLVAHFKPEYVHYAIGGECAVAVIIGGELIKIAVNKWCKRFIPSPPPSDSSQPDSEQIPPSLPISARNAPRHRDHPNTPQFHIDNRSEISADERDPELGAIRPREVGNSELTRHLQAQYAARNEPPPHLYEYCKKTRNEKRDTGTFGAVTHTIDENTRYGATSDPAVGNTLADRVLRGG